MPTYVFRCPRCGSRFEKVLTFDESEKVTCPTCKEKADRLISKTSHVWKGERP